MKTKDNILKNYIEAVLYCIILVIGVALCLSNNIYIKMIPIAFFIGIYGQVLFGKKLMTSFFTFMLGLVLTQIKTPSSILLNLFASIQITLVCITGEIFGWLLKKAHHYFSLKYNKKVRNSRVKYTLLLLVTLFVSLILNSVFYGDYLTYFKAQNRLNEYFSKEYLSSSRFNIVSAKYEFLDKMRYIFYTEDIQKNNESGRFSVYRLNNEMIQDDYKEALNKATSSNLSKRINEIGNIENVNISVFYDDTNMLTLSFSKKVDTTSYTEIETYAKDIADFLYKIKGVEGFELIDQFKIALESAKNKKEGLASYIYRNGYNKMIENKEQEPYQYIMSALNIEYIE